MVNIFQQRSVIVHTIYKPLVHYHKHRIHLTTCNDPKPVPEQLKYRRSQHKHVSYCVRAQPRTQFPPPCAVSSSSDWYDSPSAQPPPPAPVAPPPPVACTLGTATPRSAANWSRAARASSSSPSHVVARMRSDEDS